MQLTFCINRDKIPTRFPNISCFGKQTYINYPIVRTHFATNPRSLSYLKLETGILSDLFGSLRGLTGPWISDLSQFLVIGQGIAYGYVRCGQREVFEYWRWLGHRRPM